MLWDNPRVFSVVYHRLLDQWLEHPSFPVDSVEVNVESFYKTTPHRLRWLSKRYAIAARCAALSASSSDPIDARQVEACRAVVDQCDALWVTHPLGFSRVAEMDLGLPIPIPLTSRRLDCVTDRVRDLSKRLARPLLIENTTSTLRVSGTLSEPEFLNRLCAGSGCRLAVDLGALCRETAWLRIEPASWLTDAGLGNVDYVRVTGPYGADLDAQLAALSWLASHAAFRGVGLALVPGSTLRAFEAAGGRIQALLSHRGFDNPPHHPA